MTRQPVTYIPGGQTVRFGDLDGWADDDHLAAFEAFAVSAPTVLAEPGEPIVGFRAVCERALAQRAAITTPEQARIFFEAQFSPIRISRGDPAGLLTGYYEPILDGSLTRAPPFTVPIYRRPPDLENVIAERARAQASGGYSHLRRTADGLVPYATREAIERGALAGLGLELCYLADSVEAFFLHVQGSGAIRLADGALLRVTYDGKNGHPYTSVGRAMIDEGLVSGDGLTLQTMEGWLRAHTERARELLWLNKSFVFFKAIEGDAALGVLGTGLIPQRSLAVDTAYHPLGLPIYVSSPTMGHVAADGFHRLMVAHDVGSAIKGPERGDIYFGSGDAALALAGVTKHPGRFHVLVPRVAS